MLWGDDGGPGGRAGGRLGGCSRAKQQPPRFRTIQVYPKDRLALHRHADVRQTDCAGRSIAGIMKVAAEPAGRRKSPCST